MGEHEATELRLYIDSDGNLYRQMTTSILRNLATKKAKGVYQHAGAVKAFEHLATEGAKRYAKEHATPSEWSTIFSTETRRDVAAQMASYFETEWGLGAFRNLLPAKYQDGATPNKAKAKRAPSRASKLNRDIKEALARRK